jgi:hypothetical protein
MNSPYVDAQPEFFLVYDFQNFAKYWKLVAIREMLVPFKKMNKFELKFERWSKRVRNVVISKLDGM